MLFKDIHADLEATPKLRSGEVSSWFVERLPLASGVSFGWEVVILSILTGLSVHMGCMDKGQIGHQLAK